MGNLEFIIALPSGPSGFIGRECASRSCSKYFQVHSKTAPDKLFCPYCGTNAPTAATHTRSQIEFAQEVGKEELLKYAHDEFQKMLKGAVSGLKHIEYKPGPAYVKRPVLPQYREKTVDTELECPECSFRFRVNGIFGFCPKCRTENALIYDANIAIIRKQIAGDKESNRALRHAYGDLVSAIEAFFKRKAGVSSAKRNFQRLDAIDAFAVEKKGKHISDILAATESSSVRSVYQKRHVLIHNGGVIDERYIREMPGTELLLGKPVELSLAEFEASAAAVKKLLAALFL